MKIDPALRRAFMRVNPDYFTWFVEAQESYRVGMPEKDAFRIRQVLLKALFNIDVKTDKDLETARETFGDKEHLVFNRALLPTCGVGEDYFFLNESMAESETLLTFETLYDYDRGDHCFQERSRQELTPEYIIKPYRGSLNHSWARLFIDEEFYYASLSMAACHVYNVIDELGDEKLGTLIPHRYVNGKDHGKRRGKGTIFSKRIDAGGKEPQAEELRRRLWAYLSERFEALLTEFDGQARKAVYMEDQSGKDDPHMNFIFSDKTALRVVRFRHFMSDCRAIAADIAELDACVSSERDALCEYMETECRDILANFDPKAVTIRRRKEIVVADGALKGLF